MECNKADDIVEVKDTVNTQYDPVSVRAGRGVRKRDCKVKDGDSSLLFFFLLLVVLVDKSDCDIEFNTLLWFFLLLVVLYNKFD